MSQITPWAGWKLLSWWPEYTVNPHKRQLFVFRNQFYVFSEVLIYWGSDKHASARTPFSDDRQVSCLRQDSFNSMYRDENGFLYWQTIFKSTHLWTLNRNLVEVLWPQTSASFRRLPAFHIQNMYILRTHKYLRVRLSILSRQIN